MNLVLLFQEDFIDGNGRVLLKGRRYEHIRDIHRASVHDELCIGVCNGRAGTGTITAFNDQYLEMDIRLDRDAPRSLPVTLVLALPRPNMVRRILSTVSAMGVKRIFLFHSNRVEKSFWRSPVLKKDNIKEQLVLGLEQACDTIMPEVHLRKLFRPFVEDELPGLAENTLALVAHPDSISPCPSHVDRPVTLVVGPEGGFVPYEINKLKEIGFTPVHIGERIFRVESAVPILLSKLF